MVWTHYPPKKSLLGGEWWVVGGDRPNLMLAQVQVIGPYSLDRLDLDLDRDLSLTIQGGLQEHSFGGRGVSRSRALQGHSIHCQFYARLV